MLTRKLLPTGIVLFCLLLLLPQAGEALQFSLGLNAGYRYLNDASLGEIYGDGYVYEPYIRYNPSFLYAIELSYEGGYKKSVPISGILEPILRSASAIISINRILTANSSGRRSITKNGPP
jgi:hypothetical protein